MVTEQSKPHILVVDDIETGRYATTRVLQANGFEVLEAASGEEALEKAQELPDLIVLDINMPDISGFEVCKQLKSNPATSAIPVLHLSATYMDTQSKVTGLEGGADGYLTQPVDPKELVATVNSLLRLKKAEEAAERQARQWQTTFDAANDAIWVLDGEQRIVQSNRTAERFFGKSRQELIGRHCWEIVHGTSEPIPECPFLRMKQSLRRESVELPIGDRWFEVTVDPILNGEGSCAGAVHIVSDITEKKRLREELEQLNNELELKVEQRTVQLEALNKELESFAYSVSHDLRAPLRAMGSFSEILQTEYRPKLDDQGRHYLERIQVAANRMGELIDDLLTMARITRVNFEYEQVDLSKMAAAIFTELQAAEPERLVVVEIATAMKARGNKQLLHQAMENLLNNAWKFSSLNGQARIEVGQTIKDEDECFFVRDNGAGFDMAYSDKLYAPFQRLHGTAEFPGTGIGLSIVSRIVNRHGGRIWAESEVGKGATFYFTLGRVKNEG